MQLCTNDLQKYNQPVPLGPSPLSVSLSLSLSLSQREICGAQNRTISLNDNSIMRHLKALDKRGVKYGGKNSIRLAWGRLRGVGRGGGRFGRSGMEGERAAWLEAVLS